MAMKRLRSLMATAIVEAMLPLTPAGAPSLTGVHLLGFMMSWAGGTLLAPHLTPNWTAAILDGCVASP